MAHAEESITINKPASVVYDFLMDGTNNVHWRPAVLDVQRVAGKPSGVGAVFKQGVKGPGGRRIDADYEVVEAKPDELIKFQVIAGPARPTGTFNLSPADGGTRLKFTLHFEPKGFARLMDGMINKTMQSEVAMLANLKEYLEKQP